MVGPMAEDLRQAQAQTLMWPLDGALRYAAKRAFRRQAVSDRAIPDFGVHALLWKTVFAKAGFPEPTNVQEMIESGRCNC